MRKLDKSKNQKNLILVAVIIVLVSVGLLVLLKQGSINDPSLNQSLSQSDKTFESKYLNFTVTLPPGFQAAEETSRIIISSNEGQITIDRSGTELENLESYLKDFDQRTELNVINELNYSINGDEAVSRVFEKTDVSGGEEKIFFIFTNNSVYKLSTTELNLYDDLDQIAQSFKYTGN